MTARAEQPAADPATLTAFRRDVIRILARDGPQYGLAVKESLEDLYGEDVNHGRLYPNLDDLADMGLVEKRVEVPDRRTNEYRLTSRGQEAARRAAQRWSAAVSGGGR